MNSSQLLILGNGFDLHCRLKSSYKDFFRSAILDANGEQFDLKQLQAGVKGFWESLLLEYHKINSADDYNWCNIEEIIKDILWLIYYGEDSGSTSLENGLWKEALNFIKDKRDIVDDKIYQETPIKRYVFVRIVNFFECIKFEEYSNKERLHLLSNQLSQGLNSLEKRFCTYLKNQTEKSNKSEMNEKYIINAVNLLARLTGFSTLTYRNIDSIIDQVNGLIEEKTTPNNISLTWRNVNILSKEFSSLKFTHILSFNYTNIFDILETDPPCFYSNVHGKLCEKNCTSECNSSNIIFGIDDKLIQTQSKVPELRIFSKTYRKMLYADNPINILPPKNDTPIEIKFYGHSLSEADYSYFQSIFDYYDLYGNTNVSLIFYYSKGYEQQDAIYMLISSYGRTLTNIEQGKNLIHKLLLENRLHIQEVED